MQLAVVGQYAVPRESNRPQASGSAISFDSFVLSIEAAHVVAMTTSMVDERGPGVQSGHGTGTAHRNRIEWETAESRRVETDAHRSRRANPSSVQNGAVSSRHERILTERQMVPRPAALAREGMAPSNDESPESPEALNAAGIRRPGGLELLETPAARADAGADEQVAGRPRIADHAAGADQSERPVKPASGIVGPSGPTPTASARSSQVARVTGTDTPSRASAWPARTVGNLLVTRAAFEGARSRGVTQPAEPSSGGPATWRGRHAGGLKDASSRRMAERGGSEDGRVQRDSMLRQLVQHIRLNSGTRSSTATIRLDPPSLGRMRIDVRMSDDSVRVRVEASSYASRQMLIDRAGELAAALRAHNIVVEEFDIIVAPSPRQFGDGAHAGPGAEDSDPAARGRSRTNTGRGAKEEPKQNDENSGGQVEPMGAPGARIARDARLDLRV